MIDFQQSFGTHSGYSNFSKGRKNDNQTLMFSARPKIQQLPFLNNLKIARKLLVALKNQKLRKSQYPSKQEAQKSQKEEVDILRHQKAKLSVMDLISQEGKFQQFSHTIQSQLKKESQSISPIMMDKKFSEKEVLHQFQISQGDHQPLKGKQQNEIKRMQNKNFMIEKPSILTRKNQLASELNVIGHQLEQTYFQVEELQKIFLTLCDFYAENRKIVDRNLRFKQEKDLLTEKLQQFQGKIMKNQQKIIELKDQHVDFLFISHQITKKYLKELIPYNRQIKKLCDQFQNISNQVLSEQIGKDIPNSLVSCSQSTNQQKHLQINLKFRQLKSQLEKIKLAKKNTAQNKNNQKKTKNQTLQTNTFSKLYVSEIYSL